MRKVSGTYSLRTEWARTPEVPMSKFVFAYRGGSGMAATLEAQEKAMAEWGAWFGSLGAELVDGGSPFGAAATVGPDGGSTDGGSAALTGYSVVDAPDLAAAAALAKGCPLLADGGTVDVYEALPM
jgi:hypothetical protein